MKLFFKSMLAAALFFLTTSAHALLIQISESADFSGTVIEAADSDNDGLVFIDSGPGSWVVFIGGASSPLIGDDYTDLLDLFSFTVSGDAGTLYVRLTDTGFNRGDSQYMTWFGGTSTGTVSVQSYVDYTNAEFGTGFLLSDSGVVAGAFSHADSGGISPTGPFSMSIYATIMHTDWGVTSFDYMVTVPEPGTLALLGIGLLVIGLSRRRKMSTVSR